MKSPFQIGSIGKIDRGENEIFGATSRYALSDSRFLTIECKGYQLDEAIRGMACLREFAFRKKINELYIPLEVFLLLRDCQKSKVVDEAREDEIWGTYGMQERDGKITIAFWRESDTMGIVLYPDEFQDLCTIIEKIEPHADEQEREYVYRLRKKGEHVHFLKVRGENSGKTWRDRVPQPNQPVDEYGRRIGIFNWLIHPMATSISSRIEVPCYLFGRPATFTVAHTPEIDEGGVILVAQYDYWKWEELSLYLDHYKDNLWTETFCLSAGDVMQVEDRFSNWQDFSGRVSNDDSSFTWEWDRQSHMLVLTQEEVSRDDGSSWQYHLPIEEWHRLVSGVKEMKIWFEAARKERLNEY